MPAFVKAQNNNRQLDSLRMALNNAANDTIRMDIYEHLAYYYTEVNTDSAFLFTEKEFEIARQLHLKIYEAGSLTGMGYHLMNLMNYPKALESLLAAQKILEDPASEKTAWHFSNNLTPRQNRIGLLSRNHFFLALLYYVDIQEYNAGNREKMMLSFTKAKTYAESIKDTAAIGFVYWALGRECADRNKLDSALLLTQKALQYFSKSDICFIDRKYTGRTYVGIVYNTIGSIYWGKGHLDSALTAFRNGEEINRKKNNISGLYSSYSALSNLFLATKKMDSSLLYARKALVIAKNLNSFWGTASSYRTISSVYLQEKKYDSAFAYLKLASNLYDSLNFERTKKILTYQNTAFDEQLRLKKMEEESVQMQNKIKSYIMFAGVVISLLIAFLLYRNSRNRKKANELLQQKNLEIENQKKNIEETLAQLKSTQAQLIQKELSELNQKAAELEMQALRAQMNPHFIFNSLNSINRFILQNNRNLASEYLTKFSKLVRMILQNSQASLISLESELESLKLYLELEALRFNYHFVYKISVPKELDIEILKVPPLIIQPYVENAIWHGLMHKEEKGRLDIELSQEKDFLIFKISDDGVGRKAAVAASKTITRHTSMGLQITAARIAKLLNSNKVESPVTFIDLLNPDGSGAGTEVILKIPIIYD